MTNGSRSPMVFLEPPLFLHPLVPVRGRTFAKRRPATRPERDRPSGSESQSHARAARKAVSLHVQRRGIGSFWDRFVRRAWVIRSRRLGLRGPRRIVRIRRVERRIHERRGSTRLLRCGVRIHRRRVDGSKSGVCRSNAHGPCAATIVPSCLAAQRELVRVPSKRARAHWRHICTATTGPYFEPCFGFAGHSRTRASSQ